ncbi:3-phosphoshikimate 1-carboxyvinyltransferase [Halobacteriales archaeon QS_9_67_15]|nr:MAG: 3-phosphoshikimate 1-carboxyvinyltransferase [Halobacteriales archaeon QS_9_67_15]
MDANIERSTLGGRPRAPPSKSYTHRAVLAAGYGSEATVHGPLISADTQATRRAVEAYGGETDLSEDHSTLTVEGFDGLPEVPADVIDCANSGTTMRLTTATAALADGTTVLTGDSSLRSRPQGPLLDAIEQLGGRAESTRATGQAPLVVRGPVEGGRASIPGDVSSQFVTGLLMAGAVSSNGVTVDLETELKSAPYVDITIEVLGAFGVEATAVDGGYRVEGDQSYEPEGGEYRVPGDFSSMSYLLAAGALAAPDGVTVEGAYPSVQGDSAIVDVLERMGADIDWNREAGEITVRQSDLTGVEVTVADTPDLLPTIAVLGAAADGTTSIVDCEHVRYKETDRVSVMAESLTEMGAAVVEEQDRLSIRGGETELRGATLPGRDDHRIIMSLAVAGLVADGETTITEAEDVDVSFPGFFDVLADLGANVETDGN